MTRGRGRSNKGVWKRTKAEAGGQLRGHVNNPGKKWWWFGLEPVALGMERERPKSPHILELEPIKLSDRFQVRGRNPGQLPDFWLEKWDGSSIFREEWWKNKFWKRNRKFTFGKC